jgi:hypothetical protein
LEKRKSWNAAGYRLDQKKIKLFKVEDDEEGLDLFFREGQENESVVLKYAGRIVLPFQECKSLLTKSSISVCTTFCARYASGFNLDDVSLNDFMVPLKKI